MWKKIFAVTPALLCCWFGAAQAQFSPSLSRAMPVKTGASGPTLIAGATCQGGTGSLHAVTYSCAYTPTAGNALVIGLGFANGPGGPDTSSFTFTDSASDSCTTLHYTTNGTANYSLVTAYCPNISSGVTSFKVTLSSPFTTSTSQEYLALVADQVSGVSVAPYDVSAINNQSTTATTANSVTSTAASTTVDGDLIWGITINTNSNGASIGTVPAYSAGQAVATTFYTEYLIQTTHGSIAATFTPSVSSTIIWVTGMIALKHA